MSSIEFDSRLTRRGALKLGGVAAGGAIITQRATVARAAGRAPQKIRGSLPKKQIEHIIGSQGTMTPKGDFQVPFARNDLRAVGPFGVPFDGSFILNGSVYFQPLGGGRAFINGCACFEAEEVQGAIEGMIAGGLTFQALHQHIYDMKPIFFFMHYRAQGDAIHLAHGVKRMLNATSTPFPQTQPKNPKTPFDVKRLEGILKGSATVGSQGVVTVIVDRTDRIVIDGVHVSPDTNISTSIDIRPLNKSGSRAAAIPDFGMTAAEVMPVMRTMKSIGWTAQCLYNQETGEDPQLYFSHQVKVGDPYALAHEIRRGLDQTASKGSSPSRHPTRSRQFAG